MPSFGDDSIAVAVVTGNHPFDVPAFIDMLNALPGVRCYPQDLQNWAADWGQARKRYDVTLFYHMHLDIPAAGSPIERAIAELGEEERGIIVLHHGLVAYQGWAPWSELVGITDRTNGYHPDQEVRAEIADPAHPITRGLAPWSMVDETYTMADAGPDCHVLLTYDHPLSLRTAAWTRQHRRSRVFCYQAGHDGRVYGNEGFREVLRRAILWTARRI